MQVRRIRYARVVPPLAAAALAAAALTATPAQAGVAVNSHFTIGVGNHPSIVVQKNGTAQVAWVHKNGDEDDQIQYCRVPRGARKCTDLQTFNAPSATGEQPQLLMPTPSTVVIVYYTYVFPNEPSNQTWTITSTDGGNTFGAPLMIGTNDSGGGAALAPNGTVYTVGPYSSYGITVQRDNLNGTAVPANGAQATFTDEYGGSLAVFGGGSVLASHWDETDGNGTASVSMFPGVGDPNATASWIPVFSAPGETTILANGVKGAYLFTTAQADDDPAYQLRSWTGATFGAPKTIVPGGNSNEQPTFWEDASGRTNVAYWIGSQMFYRASDLKGWGVAEKLGSPGGYQQMGATAADGGGFVAYSNDDDTGAVQLVPIPVRRTITDGIHSGVLNGRVRPAVAHQPVQLQAFLHGKWVLLKTTSTNAAGLYSFKLPTGKRVYRAEAVPVEGYAAADAAGLKH